MVGYFSAQFGDDASDYVTLRLRRQKDDDPFKPGRILVGYLMGRNNEGDYLKFADVDEQGRCWIWPKHRSNERLRQAVASVLGDQRAAGEAWARASERCWRCGKRLTTPESLDRLQGEECWNKAS